MISARVDLVAGWGEELARELEQAARVALRAACEDGARTASAVAQTRRRTGLMAQMELLPVIETPRGLSSGFRSRAWYAHFQSRGTRRGITPLRFLEKGRAEARRSLVDRLNRLASR
jgi:hypothetical protein